MGGAKRAGSSGGGGGASSAGGASSGGDGARVAAPLLGTSPTLAPSFVKARRTGPAVPTSACRRPGELLRPCVRSPGPPQQQQQQQQTAEYDASWSPPPPMQQHMQQQQQDAPSTQQQQQQQHPQQRKSVRFAPGPLPTAPDGHPEGGGPAPAPRRLSWAPPPPELTRAHLAALEELLGPECAPSVQRLRRRAGLAAPAGGAGGAGGGPARPRPPRIVLTVAGGARARAVS